MEHNSHLTGFTQSKEHKIHIKSKNQVESTK